MSITTKIHIEHERLALVPTLQNLEDIAIRVITQGNTDPGSTVFPFLIEYRDRDRLEEMLDADPTVQSYELVDWTDQTGIYYIEHTPETKLISSVVTDVNGFLVHTETKGNGWLVRLLLPTERHSTRSGNMPTRTTSRSISSKSTETRTLAVSRHTD